MKKLLSILLTLAMLIPSAVFAENDEIKVFLDGEQIQFDVQPIIENDRTLVPMRAIFEALGAEVKWYNEDQIVKVYLNNEISSTALELTVGSAMMKRTRFSHTGGPGGAGVPVERIELDVPAKIISERTFVPLRAVSEAFDCDVLWDGDTKTVTITSAAPVAEDTSYEEKMLSQLPQNENYIVSPFSLKMAMMMAANGAEDETQKEILDAFGIKDIKEFNANAKQLIADLNDDEKAEVNIANSIWFNKSVGGKHGDFSEAFREIIKNDFSGTADTVTNKNSVEKVNEWTEKQTNGKIKNLLSEDNREYLAAIVNAIYMKAEWRKQFEKEATYKEAFTDIDGKETELDFMHQTAHFDYYANGENKIIKLPYTNGMSMYIALGDAKVLKDGVKQMTSKKVHLTLPKFKLDYSVGLDDILKNMGVKRAFEDNAQFDPMIQNVFGVKIDTVLQKAFIEVDEKGTEAAAATTIFVEATGALMPEEIVEFKADRPFTYYIADDKYGEVLFAGRYVKPE